jgi:cytochrome c-type biogenesis protein CcmE
VHGTLPGKLEGYVSSTVKFLIGGVVVAVVIVVLIATSFSGSTSDYITIVQAKGLDADQARNSRVAGEIVPNSVDWSTRELHLTFEIEDETGVMPISYYGPQPDMLVDAVEAVVIGKYDPAGGVFEAEELMMKCPSKYEEQQ